MKPLLTSGVVLACLVCSHSAPARVGGFESGGFEEFSWWSVANGSLEVTTERAYEGTRAARASNAGAGNQFQRVWYDVDWRDGSEVWYGLALFVPRLADWCWWAPVRWDNYATYGDAADVGGVRIEHGRLFVDVGTYASQRALLGPVAVPEGRWFWLEVHQRLSATAGEALSELYVDGVRRGASSAPNSAGRPIDTIRYGNVAMETDCSVASSIYFDRVSLTDRQLGPRPGTAIATVRCRKLRARRHRCLIARPPPALARAIGRRRPVASLRRRGVLHATGRARRAPRGIVLRMVARRPLARGRYALRLGTAGRWRVSLR